MTYTLMNKQINNAQHPPPPQPDALHPRRHPRGPLPDLPARLLRPSARGGHVQSPRLGRDGVAGRGRRSVIAAVGDHRRGRRGTMLEVTDERRRGGGSQ